LVEGIVNVDIDLVAYGVVNEIVGEVIFKFYIFTDIKFINNLKLINFILVTQYNKFTKGLGKFTKH
jgi:hypothetical protein